MTLPKILSKNEILKNVTQKVIDETSSTLLNAVDYSSIPSLGFPTLQTIQYLLLQNNSDNSLKIIKTTGLNYQTLNR
jgi:hypothetical protein